MKLYEVQNRDPVLLAALLNVWEASVRATHRFLSDAEVRRIREFVPQALRSVEHLIVSENEHGEPAAARYGVREVTVNEQNPQAVGFYEHMGFQTYRRTSRDEEGGPYPLLYMRLP